MEEERIIGGKGCIPLYESFKQEIEKQNCRSTRVGAIARRWLVFDKYD
jgi:hypothetical protein